MVHYLKPRLTTVDPSLLRLVTDFVRALAGATAVLKQRPVILWEVAAENADAVRDSLLPHGYRFYDGELAGTRPPVDDPPYSTVALP